MATSPSNWSTLSRVGDRALGWGRWLLLPWLLWLTVAVIGSSIILAFTLSTERELRYLGAGLQVFGTCVGLWQIQQIRRVFELPSVKELFHQWWSLRPRDITIQLRGIAMGTGMGLAKLSLAREMGPQIDLERRLEAIEFNLGETRRELAETQRQVAEGIASVRADILSKDAAARATTLEIGERLLKSQTGGLWPAAAALLIVLAGMAISAYAPERLPPPGYCVAWPQAVEGAQ